MTAMLIEVYRELKLSQRYRLTASTHRELEIICRGGKSLDTGPVVGMVVRVRPEPVLEAYHAAMAEKYEYAARHPWLPVERDFPARELSVGNNRSCRASEDARVLSWEGHRKTSTPTWSASWPSWVATKMRSPISSG